MLAVVNGNRTQTLFIASCSMLGHSRKSTPPNVLDCGNVSRICVQRRSPNARSPPIELAITTITAATIQIYECLFDWNTARYHADPKSVQSPSVSFEILSIAVTSIRLNRSDTPHKKEQKQNTSK